MTHMGNSWFSFEPIILTWPSIHSFYDRCSLWSQLINLHFTSSLCFGVSFSETTGGKHGQKIDSRQMKEETGVTYQLDVHSFIKADALRWWDGAACAFFVKKLLFLCLLNADLDKGEYSVASYRGGTRNGSSTRNKLILAQEAKNIMSKGHDHQENNLENWRNRTGELSHPRNLRTMG